MIKFKKALAFLTVALAASTAQATIVNFNTFGFAATTTVTSQGFTVIGVDAGRLFYTINTNYCTPTCGDNGTTFVGSGGDYASQSGSPVLSYELSLRANGGEEFTFSGFDGVEFPFDSTLPDYAAGGIHVAAFRADGTFVQANFLLDGINDGKGGLADFQSILTNFTGAFVDVRFNGIAGALGGHDFGIDNINVQIVDAADVPEPATIALLSLGLTGLALSRRRKAK